MQIKVLYLFTTSAERMNNRWQKSTATMNGTVSDVLLQFRRQRILK